MHIENVSAVHEASQNDQNYVTDQINLISCTFKSSGQDLKEDLNLDVLVGYTLFP